VSYPNSGNPPWRPTDLTPELVEQVASLVRAGNKPMRAAMARGIPRSTFYYWMARGRAAAGRRKDGLALEEIDQPHLDFLDAVERAESESQVIAVSHLMKAMPSTPTAVLAWLERRFPQEWSRTERHELTGAEGGAVQVEDFRARLAERSERIATRLLEAIGPGEAEPSPPNADPLG
jgi:transposase